jgi:hypothetical protein
LKRNAANPNRGYFRELGSSVPKVAAGIGRGLAGDAAGTLNDLQHIFTGTDISALKRVQAHGDLLNDPIYQEFLAAGEDEWANAYGLLRDVGIISAGSLVPFGALKGVSALRGLTKAGKAAKAAQVAKLAEAGVAPSTIGKIANWIGGHKKTSALIGAGIIGAGVMGAREQAKLDVTSAKGPVVPPGAGGSETISISQPRQMSKGAATLEDYIKAALRGAGFGSPEAQAYHYDPWGQTGGTAPYQAALTGSYDALNPRIAGGQAPTIKDVQRLHTGTQQSQQAYADALRAQGQAMAQRAADAGIAGYAAMQQGEGLRARMMAKDKASQEKNLINFYARANSDITRREAINSQNPDANLAKQLAEERANLEADFFNRREALGMSGEEFQE